jgi:hypothetical protein
MNCRDFRDIADTYLSDELLVETNHDVLRHLENCGNCREELNLRRLTRTQLRSAIMNDQETTINPIFANKMKHALREQSQQKSWFNWKLLTPVFASLLIGFIWFYSVSNVTNLGSNSLHTLAVKAQDLHEECGLSHAKDWSEDAPKVATETVTLVKSLVSSDTKILEKHDCEFEGKRFSHYILKRGEKVLSVLKTESENKNAANSNSVNSITSEKNTGFQVASFQSKQDTIFVISDLTEAENLSVARKLSDSINV